MEVAVPTNDADLPVDPDVDSGAPARSRDVGRREVTVLAAIALGGIVGAEARYGLAELITHPTAGWPWSTLLANVVGSLALGVLMVIVAERRAPHHLVRPFLGVGVCGGFTTFSTFAVDVQHQFDGGRPYLALGYVAASLIGCFAATALGFAATRALVPERAS